MRRLVAALLFALTALSATTLPAAAQSRIAFPQLLASVEAGGSRVVVGAQYSAEGWLIYSCPTTSLVCRLDQINPFTGAATGSRATAVGFLPPPGTQPASAIARTVEATGSGAISVLQFNNNRWTATVLRGGASAVFVVAPGSGLIQGCVGPVCP